MNEREKELKKVKIDRRIADIEELLGDQLTSFRVAREKKEKEAEAAAVLTALSNAENPEVAEARNRALAAAVAEATTKAYEKAKVENEAAMELFKKQMLEAIKSSKPAEE